MLLVLVALSLVSPFLPARAATVTWDGGGGDNRWETAANWSTDLLPDDADDVLINPAANVTIQHASASTRIRSLVCTRPFRLSGGSLIVTGGESRIEGTLNLEAGELEVQGATTVFRSTGPVQHAGTQLGARDGGRLFLPALAKLQKAASGDLRIYAYDAGSVIELAGVTSASVLDFYDLELSTANGGILRLPAFQNIAGTLSAYAHDEASLIDLSGWGDTLINTTRGNGILDVRDGGTVRMPALRHLEGMTTILQGSAHSPLEQLRSHRSGLIRFQDYSAVLTALTNVHGTELNASLGSRLQLPAVTELARQERSDLRIIASDSGSLVDIPNATSSTVQDYYHLELQATDGAVVRVPRLASFQGGLSVYAEEADSRVELPALTGVVRHNGPGSSSMEARDGGTIALPGMTDIEGFEIYLRNSGGFPLGQLRSLKNGQLRLTNTKVTLPNLTDTRGANLVADGGAQILLPNLTRLERAESSTLSLRAFDPGSLIRLPAVTQAAVADYYRLELHATDGARIELPSLATFRGSLDVYAEDADSVVDLPGFRGDLADTSPGISSITARADGKVLLPNVTRLSRVHIAMRGTGQVPLPGLTELKDGSLTLQGARPALPALTDISGSNLELSEGAQLVLDRVTAITNSRRDDITLRAQDAGTLLRLPQLRSVTVILPYQLEVYTYTGARIELPLLNRVVGSLTLYAENAGSVIDLTGWQGPLNLPEGGRASIEARNNGAISFPGLTALHDATLILRRGGVVTTAQLTAITDSRVTLDAAIAAFPALADTTGTTFDYLNGGSASFPTPADLQIRSVVAPSLVTAPQAVTVIWEILNRGTPVENATWSDAVYLSADNTIGDDAPLGNFSMRASIPAGGSIWVTNQILIPARLAGIGRLVVEANRDRLIFEGTNTANNLSIATNPIDVRAPDLRVEGLALEPNPATFGRTATARWTVRNAGTAPASAPWEERLVLRAPPGSSAESPTLFILTASAPLAPGATLSRSQSLSLPLTPGFPAGNHTLALSVDSRDLIEESNEANNGTTATIAFQLPPLPDLQISQVTHPAESQSGGVLTVGWSLTNAGPGVAAPPWTESVSLRPSSQGAEITGTTLLLIDATNALAASASATRSRIVQLPAGLLAGTYTLSVTADSQNQLYEAQEANNASTGNRSLLIPAQLEWTLPITSIPENANPPTIATLIRRNGDPSQPLTVTLAAAPSGELSVPPTVTFPAGQSTVPITLTVLADGVPDADVTVALSASAAGYRPAEPTLIVRNTDLPRLTLQPASPSVVEGQSVSLTVSRDGPTASALIVHVAAPAGTQVVVPEQVVIPAGQRSAVFAVSALDDSVVEPNVFVRVDVFAPEVQGTSVDVTITDNDLASFSASVADRRVSEAGGSTATTLTVTRGAATPRSLEVLLESSQPTLVRIPARAAIPAGQSSVSIPLEIVDNLDVDGDRSVTLRAAALASFSETVVANAAPVTLVVTDDDGPTLTVEAERDVLAEGVTGATFLRVTRNSAVSAPLSVQLAATPSGEVTLTSPVTIPAGTNATRVPISTLDDNRVDGNQTVRITATAAGHSSAETSVTVTDLAYPDLIVRSVTGPESGESEAPVNIQYRIDNQGLTSAGTNWVTRVFLSSDPQLGDDTLIVEYPFGGTLPVGQSFAQSRQIRLPSVPGEYWLIATTDIANQIPEILEINNTTIADRPMRVEAAYRATVQAQPTAAAAGTPIRLTGTALRTSTGGPAPFVLVNLHIRVRDTHRVISAITDDQGRFSTDFQPLPGEAGIYEVGASHPGLKTAPVQATFQLYGVGAEPVEPLRLTERSSVTGRVFLRNLGDVPLQGLSVTTVSNLAGVQVTATPPAQGTLGPLAEGTAGFVLTANDGSAGTGTIVLRVASREGAVVDVPLSVTVAPDEPRLEARPVDLIAGVRSAGQAMVRFEIVNSGGSASEPVYVTLPPELPWVRLANVEPLPPVAAGTTNVVTLQLRPGPEVALGEYPGSLRITAGTVSVQVPFRFRVLSDAKGDLRITAVDEYTYYAEGSPKVAGAEVTVLDAVSELVVTNGVTDASGQLLLRQLPEGWYDIRVRADRHAPFRDTALVVAGFETNVTALLSRQAVRYLWTVVPTEIEDRTRISIETVFEAFVPMPVVTIEPNVIDLADVTADVTQIDLRITNHGLVAAKKAVLGFSDHPDWRLTPLIEELGDLPARSTLTIPLTIRKLKNGATAGVHSLRLASGKRGLHSGGGGCGMAGGLTFEIPCGGGTIGGGAGVAVVNAGSGCGGGGGGGFPGGSGGSSGGRGGSSGGGSGSSSSIRSCDPCLLAILNCLLEIVLPDFLDCAKDLYGCAKHDKDDYSAGTAWDCTKAGLTCAEALGAELSKLNTAIDVIECIQELAQNCGSPPGGGGGGGGGSDDGGGGSRRALAGRVSPSQTALQTTLSSRVERAELTLLRQRADWLSREMAPIRYLLGHDAWFGNPQPVGAQVFLGAFLDRIEPGTENGIRIGSSELTTLAATPVPSTVSASILRAFLERWNRSVDYWEAGIFTAAKLAPGQNPDFIDMEVLRTLSRGQIEADAESVAAGFRSPSDAFNRAAGDILRFLGEGDSGGVCAHVRIRLDQDLVMTRDAFDATLEIENALPEPIENVSIEVIVRRRTGEGAQDVFVTQAPVLTGITGVDGSGVLAGSRTGTARWRLIPTPQAAPSGPQEFLVGGQLKYRQGGLNVTVPLAPATITVHPSPSLAVKYFHQRDVFADDPFTPAVEPSVPYSLAVMVENRGFGTARNVRIASAQPRIVDNEKGLLVDFKILATEVAGQSLQPSLTVDFGSIAPRTNAIGRWLLTSSILGGFLEYSATVEHQNDLGDKRLSLIEGIEIHELIHLVRAPAPRDDGRPDFLVNDLPDLLDYPDTVHLSNGSREPVASVIDGVVDREPNNAQLEVNLTAQVPSGWVYLRLPDPGQGRFRLTRVLRSDGVEIALGENVWTTDRTFLGNARRPIAENTVHLFDLNSTGRYRLVYTTPPPGDTTPPSSRVAALPTESTAVFAVTWDGTDNPGGSGIQSFDVYASIDDQPFALWQQETLDRSAIYQGALGHTYRFYSVAVDLAGNREAAPSGPDALTRATRINQAPFLANLPDVVLREGATLSVQPVARDPDGDALVFSLVDGLPPGITIHPYTGAITWVTGEGSGPASYPLTVQVLDTGLPRLGATRSFSVVVSDDNAPPLLDTIASRSIREGETLSFTVQATDPDLPKQNLTYELATGAPAGATLNPSTGVFRWTPQNAQGGATYPITVRVRDSGTPPLTATRTFQVSVDDSRADFSVRLGDANTLVGELGSIPIQVTSSPDLSQLVLDLAIDGQHLTQLELVPVAGEIIAASLEPIGPGEFRVQLDLSAVGLIERTRDVAHLRFLTVRSGRSGIDVVSVSSMTGLRRGGETLRSGTSRWGRVFVVESEPLMDAGVGSNGRFVLTVFGLPGRTYRLEQAPQLGTGSPWTPGQTATLTGRSQVFELPAATGAAGFFRVREP